MNYNGNAFLKSFMEMRASLGSAPDKLGATALSPIGGQPKKGSAAKPPEPLSGLGAMAAPTPEMLRQKIIDNKPGKKEVEKYFKMRCEANA